MKTTNFVATLCICILAFALIALGQEQKRLQWIENGSIRYALAPQYDYSDRASHSLLQANLRAMGDASADGKLEIEFAVTNSRRSPIVVYNPGFNELAPPAGEIAVFTMSGEYEYRANLPPAGFIIKRDDWMKLERGQKIATKCTVPLPPGRHIIQIIYWKWLLTPQPAADEPFPTLVAEGLGDYTEIMRSNSIEVLVPERETQTQSKGATRGNETGT